MKLLKYICLALIFVACSTDDTLERNREPWENNGPDTEADNTELADEDTRFVSDEWTARYGEPGILYLLSDNHQEATLLDIESGRKVTFYPTTRRLHLDGKEYCLDMVKIKEEGTSQRFWYKGTSIMGKTVYFVYDLL